MEEYAFLKDLTVVMIVAGLVTVVFHKLKQPAVLGYLLAGVIVGPNTPPGTYISDPGSIKTMAELGIIFLMFSVGLGFSLRKFMKVGAMAIVSAVLETILMVWLGFQIGKLFGWGSVDSFFLGGIIAITSSTIFVKLATDMGLLRERFAQIVLGISIGDDIMGIILIALLPTVSVAMAGGEAMTLMPILKVLGVLASFFVGVMVLGLLFVPALLRYVARFGIPEMLLITVLGLLFAVAMLSQKLGFGVALGAFLTGAIIGETSQRAQIEGLAAPIRDMFTAVFFVTAGMLIDPMLLKAHWMTVLVLAAAVIIGKMLTCGLGPFLFGQGVRTSLRVGLGMGVIGEVSFIIAQRGETLKVTSDFLYPIAVATSAVTTLIGPYLIRNTDEVAGALERTMPRPMRDMLDLYSRWVSNARSSETAVDPIRKLVRRTILQFSLNLILVATIFVIAGYATRRLLDIPRFADHEGGTKTLMWLAAMILTLPLIIATLRKTRAMAMLIAELIVTRRAAGEQAVMIRTVVTNIIVTVCTAVVGMSVLVLSSTLRPPTPVLIALIVVLIAIVALMWRSFIHVYARAQSTIAETLSQPDEPLPALDSPGGVMSDVLVSSPLNTVIIRDKTAAVGHRIRELNIRYATGASIVMIERQGAKTINPGPDYTLQPGDLVTLLGETEQIDAARVLFNAPPQD